MRQLLALLTLCALAVPALANAPDISLRPLVRGSVAPPANDETALSQQRPNVRAVADSAPPAYAATRPVARPAILEAALASSLSRQLRVTPTPGFAPEPAKIADTRAMAFAALSPQATGLSLRPFLRPNAIVQKAMARQRERRRGALCGNPDIQGEEVGFVPGRIRGCGIDNAVRVRSVSGVALSQQALMDCGTAKALNSWINNGAKRAVGQTGGGLARIRVAAHYACRTRNNQPGAKISEHGRGRAIDISAFTLRDGQRFTVLDNWGRGKFGQALRSMHRAACGPFGTVLGPESDRFHRDHFHFDTARYRSGSYCR